MYRSLALVLIAILAPKTDADDKKKTPALPAVERGPEHKLLASFAGTWDAKVKYFINSAKPIESDGVMTRTMILDGNYLQESFKGSFVGKGFSGIALIGYDYHKDKFMTTWCDNMSTSMRLTRGSYDLKKKAIISVGEEFEPNTKKTMKIRDVLRLISADEQVLEMYALPDGADKEFKVMEVHYTRRKPAKN